MKKSRTIEKTHIGKERNSTDLPRSFMILRKEEMTLEIGFNSTVAFPLFSAFTIDLNASFNILLPISLSLSLSLYPEKLKPLSRTQSHSEFCEVWGFLILSGILDIRINSMDILDWQTVSERKMLCFFLLNLSSIPI